MTVIKVNFGDFFQRQEKHYKEFLETFNYSKKDIGLIFDTSGCLDDSLSSRVQIIEEILNDTGWKQVIFKDLDSQKYYSIANEFCLSYEFDPLIHLVEPEEITEVEYFERQAIYFSDLKNNSDNDNILDK